MGFYGNITNTSKVQFTFDKTYPNRTTMDASADSDGVYVGRFVLVDYDCASSAGTYTRLYKYNTNWFGFFFSVPSGYTDPTIALYAGDDEPYYIQDEDNITTVNPKRYLEEYSGYIFKGEPIYTITDTTTSIVTFYQCIGGKTYNGRVCAEFTKMTEPPNDIDPYYTNFITDRGNYSTDSNGIGRGYDSTVWQKVYSEGKQKYVSIAELNSVVPSFGITVDPPTIEPMAPHFGADSTNTFYRLHTQPNWGFKIKEAKDKEFSDTQVNAAGNNWNNETNNWETTHELNYPGSIYYNKDGFDSDYHIEKNQPVDEISLLPTGRSGYKYNNYHNRINGKDYSFTHSEPAEQNDIQELVINLPSIGDSISAMWDIVYGKGDSTADEKIYKRNKNIDWDSYAGNRLIRQNKNGNGFEYNTDEVATLSGCINSVHDLMGMIIINDENNIAVEDSASDYIYYRNKDDGSGEKGYYIKALGYEFDDVAEGEFVTEKVENLKALPDKYYQALNDNYYFVEEYKEGNEYCTLKVDPPVEVYLADRNYKANTYYYYNDEQKSYIKEGSSEPDDNKTYYYIEENVSNGAVVDNITTFFFPTNEAYYTNTFPTVEYDVNTGVGSGLFYYDATADQYYPFVLGTTEYRTPLIWWQDYKAEAKVEIGTADTILVYDITSGEKTNYNMVKFERNQYFYEDKVDENGNYNYVFLQSEAEIDKSKMYYSSISMSEPEQVTGLIDNKTIVFYKPNSYYYLEGKSYYKAKEDVKVKDSYYTISENGAEDLIGPFYQPNKYYYEKNGEYIIDTGSSITPGREYYNYYERYIVNGNGIYNNGEKCNPNVKYADLGVNTGIRKEKYEWKELIGFARSLNTIHGLIIQINNLLNFNNSLTRDTTTVQGCINKVNDIINTFNTLHPNRLLIVNEMGKVSSATNEAKESGDSWIELSVKDGEVHFKHKGPVGESDDLPQLVDVTPQFGETFVLADYGFDDVGHKYAEKTHTVKIPQGSLINNTTKSELNVVTNIDFTPAIGEIAVSRTNIADLKVNSEQTLHEVIDGVESSVSNEASTREAADKTLQDNISLEVAARETADITLQANIDDEKSARQSADSALQENISNEENARISAINELENKIATVQTNLDNAVVELDVGINEINNDVTDLKSKFSGDLDKIVYSTTNFNYILEGEDFNPILQNIIDSMSNHIASLQSTINTLEARIEALEGESSSSETESE